LFKNKTMNQHINKRKDGKAKQWDDPSGVFEPVKWFGSGRFNIVSEATKPSHDELLFHLAAALDSLGMKRP